MAINPVFYKKLNYDAEKDFTPVSFYVKAPFILVVNPELPVKTVPELIKYAKESATPVTFASLGIGTAAASGRRIHEAALQPQHDPCAVSQHRAVACRPDRRATSR